MILSIIIPIFKTPPELFELCMNSVLAWSGEEVEFILVIDSPNHPIEKSVYEYAAKDRRIRVFRNNENRGPSYSRNRGINEAKGEYVLMVDADDSIVPHICQKALDYCQRMKLAYCAVARVYPWQKDGIDCHETHQLYVGSLIDSTTDIETILSKIDMQSSGVVYDLRFLNSKQVRYPEDIRQNEDFVFLTSVVAKGGNVGLWDEYGYIFHGHANSLSHIRDQNCYENQLSAANKIYNLINKYNLSYRILLFYANHAYNQVFAPWHRVQFDSVARKRIAVLELGNAAKRYVTLYDLCLRQPAKLLIQFVSVLPVTMFLRPPLVHYGFRFLRKFGWYFTEG